MNLHDEPALAVYGACLNTAAIAAARLGATQAHDYLDEALQVAGHLGRDRNDLFTAFGVTNVGIHRVSVSVALGEGPRAVESAAVINPAALPAERRAHLLIDLAQAQEQDEEVAEALLTAEAVAPEEVRYNPAARALVAGLLRRRPSQVVRALAERIDVSA